MWRLEEFKVFVGRKSTIRVFVDVAYASVACLLHFTRLIGSKSSVLDYVLVGFSCRLALTFSAEHIRWRGKSEACGIATLKM